MDSIIDSQLLTTMESQHRSSLLLELDKIQILEEVMWKSGSKTHWLKEGHANIKYFYRITNHCRHKNHIPLVKKGDITYQTQPTILSTFIRYNRFLLGETNMALENVMAPRNIFTPAPPKSFSDYL